MFKFVWAGLLVCGLMACEQSSSGKSGGPPLYATVEELGEQLFHDTRLSLNGSQSCATCHNPEHAFIDNRQDANGDISAVSLGDDGFSLGDRNTPTAAYAAFTPSFHMGSHARINSQQADYEGYVGGLFLDGRATDLEAQAGGPPLNPIEMGMPDKTSVVDRLLENEDYVASFKWLYGNDVTDNTAMTYQAMTESIAAFERSAAFSPFTSKYDKSLRGEYFYDPLSKAAHGKSLFFSQQFSNCATCHQLKTNGSTGELFTSFEYHNIGVPINTAARAINGVDAGHIDHGLLANPDIDDQAQDGKFKVPTLRNIAVTGPYMHNGVFKNLRTVIEFYDHFLEGSEHMTNTETGEAWRAPEVAENINLNALEDGKKLSDQDIESLVCFLRTLTDARYEALIPEDGVDCD